jgi:hypothetical protein
MKIGIVTLYDALNYGAYFQALSMQRFLSSMGHEPEFINLEIKHPKKFYQTPPRKAISRKSLQFYWFNLRKNLQFKRAWRHLNVNSASYQSTRQHYDAIVLGSDEIWSVRNSHFDPPPECFGSGLNADRLISYAPSVGRSTAAEVAEKKHIQEGIKRIQHLSGRDAATCETIRMVTECEPVKVLDPTFLSEFDGLVDEDNIEKGDFILVYTYGFSGEKIAIARELSMRTGMPLISVGFIHPWCHRSVPADPFQFLGLLKRAKYIITNTFHGTCLSLILRRPFGVFSAESQKLSALIQDLNLSAVEITNVESALEGMNSHYITPEMETLLEKRKQASIDFLTNALE